MSEPTPAPAAGAVVAVTASLAASLAAMAAGSSTRQLPDADDLVARALAARDRLLPLAHQDGEVYAEVLAARALPDDSPDRQDAIRRALEHASEIPHELARTAAEVAALADRVAADGNPHLQGDAATAALLARTAVTAAAGLVEANLSGLDADHPRLVEAQDLVRLSGRR